GCAGDYLLRRAVGIRGARARAAAHAADREAVFAGPSRRDAGRNARGAAESPIMMRRSFLSTFSAVAALIGPGDQKPSESSPGRFEPARHTRDDWFDQLPGKHRVVFDTWSADKFDDAIRFANNIFRGNK